MFEHIDASPELIKKCEEWVTTLEAHHKDSVRYWTGSGFREINNILSNWLNDHVDYSYESDQDRVSDLLLVLGTAPKFSGELWRGSKKDVSEFSIGDQLDINRLSSWSIDPSIGKEFATINESMNKYGVVYRANAVGYYIDSVSSFGRNDCSKTNPENEVILAPYTAKITGITQMEDFVATTSIQMKKTPRVYTLRAHRSAFMSLSHRPKRITTRTYTGDSMVATTEYSKKVSITNRHNKTHALPICTPKEYKQTVYTNVSIPLVDLEITPTWS